ncbi:MAG: hypothetical protein OCD02_19995 [Spirochaetaceae bacterium]
MLHYSGIDEAGLGPILGPFCAASTTFYSPSPLKELLADQQKKLFYVDDSKKVYQGKNGLYRLELNILSFYLLLHGQIPKDTMSFIPSMKTLWNSDNIELPIIAKREEIYEKADKIKDVFDQRGIRLIDIKRTAVSAENFNKLIDIWDNKSVVCQKIINPLILSTTNIQTTHQMVIDKQGGRKFYKEYLDTLLNSSVEIIREEPNHSQYKKDNMDIHFRAKADSSNFCVALSSMFAKYMREVSMAGFNNYWIRQYPELKRTAGYYTDGIRFINQLKDKNLEPQNIDTLIRKK